MNIRRLMPRRRLHIRHAGPIDQTAAFLNGLAAIIARYPDLGARPGGRRLRIDLTIRPDKEGHR